MHGAIYYRHKRLPDNDIAPLTTIQEVGIMEEEIILASAQNNKGKGSPRGGRRGGGAAGGGAEGGGTEAGGAEGGRAEGGKAKDKFAHLATVWKSTDLALRGVDQAQIDEHKAVFGSCWRCGGDRHRTTQCRCTRP